jgi:hypothetical protein
MEINYNYSKKDQLNHPQKYQKTPFHGKNFLSEYKNLRKNKIEILIRKIKKEFKIEEILKNIQIKKNGESEFFTNYLLKSILKDSGNLEKNDKIINIFIKKFEVKKRIFSSYNKLFIETSSNYQEIINYILLSTICIIKYEKTKNLKFLNTVLKLNDLLCSEIENIEKNEELNLVLYCLKEELNFILKIEKRLSIF